MNDLYRALGDISSIRRQVAGSTEFRGYGPATSAVVGLLAIAAAVAQWRFVPEPATHMMQYLTVWSVTALISASLTAWHMYTRSRRMHSGMSSEMIRMAVEQLLPSVVAGALLTFVLMRYVPQATWMLSGLWQIIFSLGVLSSCRFLPKPMIAAGAWYLLTGLSCIAMADERALSPWAMGIPFAVGQFLVAAVLQLSHTGATDEI
jgi:hypothetical protein